MTFFAVPNCTVGACVVKLFHYNKEYHQIKTSVYHKLKWREGGGRCWAGMYIIFRIIIYLCPRLISVAAFDAIGHLGPRP